MRDLKIVAILLGAVFLVVAPLGLAMAQPLVKMGVIGISAELPLYVARELGYFTQQGLKLETERVVGGAAAIPALVGGSLQLTHSAYVSAYAARAQGFDIIIVAPFDKILVGHDTSGIVVKADSGINAAKDLEGKTLAVNVLKSLNWLYASEWMAKNGADPKKVNWVEVPFPHMIGAVRTGKVEGAYATEPFITLELEQGGIRVVTRPFSSVDPGTHTGGVVASEKWVRANQEVTDRFARALRQGIDYLNANKEKWPELFARHTALKKEWVPRLVTPHFFYPVDMERLQFGADLALKWGLISKKLSVKEMVWPTALAK